MKNASALKSMITNEVSLFNPKGIKEIQAANYCRFVFSTNKGNPFEQTDGERRFLVLNAKPTKKGDTSFWSRIRAELFRPAAGKAIADYLLARDITGWVIQEIPMTEYQLAIIDSEKTSEQQFLENWEGEEVSASDLYNLYRQFCIDKSLPYTGNSIALGKRLLPLMRDGLLVRRKGEACNFYRKP